MNEVLPLKKINVMKKLTLLLACISLMFASCEKKDDNESGATDTTPSFKLVLTDPIPDPSTNELSTLTKEYSWETSDVKVLDVNNAKSLVAVNVDKNANYTTNGLDLSQSIQENDMTTLLMGADGLGNFNFVESSFVIFSKDEAKRLMSGTVKHTYWRYLNLGTTTKTATYTGFVNIKFDNVKY